MYFKSCPRCGASLDPGEKCDCIENGPPHANENGPRADAPKPQHISIVSQSVEKNNADILRQLRLKNRVSPSEIVEVVRKIHPRFDRYLLSKCEHYEKYGVTICTTAMDAIVEHFAPILSDTVPNERS